MNKDVLSEIFKFIEYKDLYATTQVDQLWHKVSQNQLLSHDKSDPILPLLHNRLIKNTFVGGLHDIYTDYIKNKVCNGNDFLHKMNWSYNSVYGDGTYSDIVFIILFNQQTNNIFSANIEYMFDLLYTYIWQKLIYEPNCSTCYSEEEYKLFHLGRRVKKNKPTLFIKMFVVFMYMQKLLIGYKGEEYANPGEYMRIHWWSQTPLLNYFNIHKN